MSGSFYIIQLAPDVSPQRLKMGWAFDPSRRISLHRIAAPSARLLGTWPCERERERPAIRILTRSGCTSVAASKEVFDCEDVGAVVAQAEQFFVDPDWTLDPRILRPRERSVSIEQPAALTPADLRAYRIRLGLTQAQLARLLDIPDSTLSRWERGLMVIASPTILYLALERLSSPD